MQFTRRGIRGFNIYLTGSFNHNVSLLASKQKSDGVRSPECWQVLQQAVFALASVNRSLGGDIKHHACGFFPLCLQLAGRGAQMFCKELLKFQDAKLLEWL